MTLRKLLTLGLASASLLGACRPKDDAEEEFRNSIPRGETVTVRVPGTNSGKALVETQAQPITLAQGQTADFYKLTWAASNIFNGGALLVLGLVKTVVSFPPTTLTADTAVWGPWTGALDPITWKVTVTRRGDHLYSYTFEGRDRNAPSAPFITVLSGDHTPTLDAKGRPMEGFGSGSFTLDNDARQRLPMPGADVGKAHYTYERSAPAAMVAIDAQFIQVKDDERPGQLVDLGYRYRATPGNGGSMEFLHSAPATMTMAGTIWKIKSRWLETGAGRSDVVGQGGDIPAGQSAKLSECWDQTFASRYQLLSWTPLLGWGTEATDCVFTSAEFSTL
jgi:hypothetical protein